MSQVFTKGIENLEPLLKKLNVKKFLLVCDSSFPYLNIKDCIESIKIDHVVFNQFSSNPLHDDADKGRELFTGEKCDCIVAVGGGSSLDVAKCIKLDSGSIVPLVAIPTTAGTGSESTRHIVVYRDGKKESLGNETVIPNYVVFEPKVLKTLPVYQKKCTMLDALCQGIESYWSVNANSESRILSKKAIELIVSNMDKYILENDEKAAEKVMEGANYSGQAINLTQTTAAHAMSYKITSLYKLPHGHAVAVCLPEVWETMLKCNPSDELQSVFKEISHELGYESSEKAISGFRSMMERFEMANPKSTGDREEEIKVLTTSVNPVRLKNNPIQFTEEQIAGMYERIVG